MNATESDGSNLAGDVNHAGGAFGSEHDLLAMQTCVLNSMLEGVSVSDEQGIIQFTNTAEDELFGYGTGELIGQHVTVLNAYSPEENARRVSEVIEQLQRTGSWTGNWLNRKKSGEVFETQSRITAVNARGRKYWVCVQSEVGGGALGSEMESRRLAAIVESSDDAIITKDLNGIITSWNRGAQRIFGYKPEEVIGKPVAILAAPSRKNEMPNILGRIRNGEFVEHYETERRTKDGRIISVSLTVSPLRNGAGEIIGASKIARDVTESKRMQAELATREQEYSTLLANLPDTITRLDKDLRIHFISDAVRNVRGYGPEHYLGKTHREAGVPSHVADLYEAAAREVLISGEQRTLEFAVPNSQGLARHYFCIAVPERRNGETVGVLTISRDITDRKIAEMNQLAVERELMLLVEASSALIASPHSAEVLDTILELASRFVSAEGYGVWRRQKEGEWRLLSSSGLSAQYIEQDNRADRDSAPIRQTVVFEDVLTNPYLGSRREAYEREGIRTMMVVPLWIHGQFSGTIAYYWRQNRKISDGDVRIASALGNLASAALGTADLYEEETRTRKRAQLSEARSTFLAKAGAVLSSSLDYNATLQNVARLAVPDFADWCSADVLNEQGNPERVVVYHSDPAMMQLAEEYRAKYPPREDDLSRVVLRSGKSVLLSHIPEESVAAAARSPEHLETLRKLELRSIIIVPMVVGAETLGVITLVSSSPERSYDERDLETAEELARRAGAAIFHSRLYGHVRESEERLRLAIAAAQLGVWEHDRATGALVSSEQCKRNVGVDPDGELTYADLTARIHPDDRSRWNETVDQALAEHKPFEVEYRVQQLDGSLKWVLAYGQGIYSQTGEIQRTVGVTLDVTEKRTLLQREKQARRTAELLNGIGPVLLTELDPSRLAHRVVAIAAQLVGAQLGILFYGASEADATPLYAFYGLDRLLFENMPVAAREALISHWRGCDRVRREAITEPDSSPFAELAGRARSLLAVPIYSRSGEIVGSLLFAHENTAAFDRSHEAIVLGIAAQASIALENARLFETARATEEALRLSNEELRRVNEDLNQFAYSASHDLQEPLRMVAIYSQMLGRRYEHVLDQQGKEYLGYTVRGAKRMEMLVKDLLAYTQAGAAAGEEADRISAEAVLREALQALSGSIEETGAEIIHSPLPELRVQEVHLMQLFLNLISNALKYRKSDERPRIVVEHSPECDGKVELRIRDNGIGIPPEYQKQVFGLFKRLHAGDKYSGTGIGLAICQRIVERYGGLISVESEPGVGSTFRFTLPA